MTGDVLNLDHLRKAREILSQYIEPAKYPLNHVEWDEYKRVLGWSDEKMDRYFLKSHYIPMDEADQIILGGEK